MEAWGGRALNASEMGLGKTLETLWLIKRNASYFPVLVVCPAAVKWHWHRAASTPQFGYTPAVLSSRTPAKQKEFPAFCIINYDILFAWLPWLQELSPRCIVLDECQAIGDPSSRRSKITERLCEGVPHIIGLSGTPMMNRPIDMFPILRLIAPHEFGNRPAFGHRYCGPKKKPWGWEYKGASNVKELNERLLSTCMIRRLKKDVLHQLPKKVRQVVTLEINDPEKSYKQANNDFLNWLAAINPSAAVRAAKAEVVVQIGYLKRLAARLKARAACDWIENFLTNTNEKLVTFAVHTKFLDLIERRFGPVSVRVDGSTSSKARMAAVERFQTDPACRLFNGNIQAAGTGIDGLQRVASTAAILEMDYRPAIQLQAEARIDRIGQDEPSFIYYLIAANTIEERIAKTINNKQDIINGVIDGATGGGETFDVLDEIIKGVYDDLRTLGIQRPRRN